MDRYNLLGGLEKIMTLKIIKFYAPAVGWGIFVFILSTLPGKDFPKIPDLMDLFSVDKMVHMLFYGTFSGLILRGWRLSQTALPSFQKIVMISLGVAAFCSCYGWFLEWIQENFCEDRMFEILDGVANTIGAVVSCSIFVLLQSKKIESENT